MTFSLVWFQFIWWFINDIKLIILSCREAEKRQKKKLLLDYLYANLKNHNFWAYRYFFCEFLGILNVVGENYFISPFCSTSNLYCPCPGQMFLMDRFFDGTFLTFGIEVISFAERDQEDRIDPMVRPSNAGGTMIFIFPVFRFTFSPGWPSVLSTSSGPVER